MRVCLSVLALIVTVSTAAAQDVVHPNQYAASEGAGDNWYPFRYNNSAGHYQQSHDASQFYGPITISEISFRYKSDKPKPSATADFRMTLAYCANPWNALSPTFASNIGSGATVVFDGVWNIQAFPGDPATPNPFTERLTLTTPFTYFPSLGDLIIDIEMRQSTYPPGASGAFAISHANVGVHRVYADTGNPVEPVGIVSTSGLIAEFKAGIPTGITPYGAGCPGLGGCAPVLSMTGSPTVGQQVTLALDKGLGGAMSALFIGLSQSSLPLGGGCTLLSPPAISLFIPLGGSGPCTGSYKLPAMLPPTPPVTIYLQAFVNDPAGPIALTASNGLRVDIQ